MRRFGPLTALLLGHRPLKGMLPRRALSSVQIDSQRDMREFFNGLLPTDPDVALLGLSFPNEQDTAFEALAGFQPLTPEQMEETRRRAEQAVKGKGPCWWNPSAA